MSTRMCVYKDCNNFYCRTDNTDNCDVTLFAFPKDQKRADQWRLLGQVHPKIGPKNMYMCSAHFDARFLSTNKNRRILLGEAIPFPYEDAKKEKDEHLNQMTPTSSSSAHQMFYINQTEDDNPKCSSTQQQSFYINLDDDDDLRIDKVVKVESTTAQAKESILLDNIEVSIVPSTCKRARRSSSDVFDEEQPEAIDDDQLIDANEVSNFKFKGEQYVQMSRDYYLQEKRQMLNQLNTYKRVLTNIEMELKPLKDL